MPKIAIRNLDPANNKRLKLIKSPSSIVDIGLQQGVVTDGEEYVAICLTPNKNPISCSGATNSARFKSAGSDSVNSGYKLELNGQVYRINNWDETVETDSYLYAVITRLLADKLEIEVTGGGFGTDWYIRNKTKFPLRLLMVSLDKKTDFQVHENNSNPTLISEIPGEFTCCLTRDPIPINATYDSFKQSITAIAPEGLLIETKDPDGNVIGSGIPGVDGTVTYSLTEGAIPDKSILETSGKDLTVVQHQLIASSRFLYEVTTPNYNASIDVFDSGTGAEIIIDWGDGSTLEVSNSIADSEISIGYPHTFVEPGEYVVNVRVQGGAAEVKVRNHHKLLEWGPLGNYIIQNSSSVFYEVVPNDISPLITSCNGLFSSCSVFNQSIEHWEMKNVTNTQSMFLGCSLFNQPLNNWDTSNFERMGDMFYGAKSFNQPLDKWDLNKATDFIGMFSGCETFNQDLSGWKTPLATGMGSMFYRCTAFNQNLSGWCVPLIASEPNNFNVGGILTEEQKPVWGTCPNP